MAALADKVDGADAIHTEHAVAQSHSSVGHNIKDERHVGEVIGRDFTVNDADIPAGYFKSFNFLGSMFAIGLSFGCGVGGFTLAAPILSIINNDIGPDANIIWVSLAYLLTTSIGLIIVGRVSDIFGRRWWFVGGCAIGTLGCIVASVAPNVPALIAAETLIGIGGAVQISYAFIVSELVPQKYRFIANAYVFLWGIPFSGLAPAISYSFIYHTNLGWRGVFYLMIAMNGLATLAFIFCYHPPTFHAKHGARSKLDYIKHFDYIGTFIGILGLLLFLMGLSWGGTVYPWKSAHVIACMTVGGLLTIAFFAYEALAPLKEPLLPMYLLKNRGWNVTVIIWAIGAGVYYANALLWPGMVVSMYSAGHGPMWIGWMSCIPNCGILFGEYCACWYKKNTNWQICILFSIGAVFLALMATSTPDTSTRSAIFVFIASAFVGAVELLSSTVSTLCIDDQREIGTATGAAGSCRSLISTICSTVYTVILSNRLAQTIPSVVPPALIAAGLPETSVAGFMAGLTAGSFADVSGVTPGIIAAGVRANADAYNQAYRTVWLSTIAFTGLGVILSFFAPNVNHMLTGDVVVQVKKYESGSDVEKTASTTA